MSKTNLTSRRVTIQDVAARVGVSIMTVSNVLNGAGKASDATRAKVRKAVEDLGYAPNPAARRLASGIDLRIALLSVRHRYPLVGDVVAAAVHACAQHAAQLVLEEVNDNPKAAIPRLVAMGASALIVPPPYCSLLPFMRAVARRGVIPIGITPGAQPLAGYSCVWIDDRKAACDATLRLVALGHRRIGFIRGPDEHPAALERLAGFRLALEEAGIPVESEYIEPGDFDFASGLAAAEKLLRLHHPPTAIFAANDDMAAGVLSAAYRHQRRIPTDLSVVGFDDSILATRLTPQLTTVRQPVRETVEIAVEIGLNALRAAREGRTLEPVHRQLAYEIVERETTAPPRRKGAPTRGKQ